MNTELRAEFEGWISHSPYERNIERWPNDSVHYGWPGQYQEINTQLAWEAFQKGRHAGMTEAESVVEEYAQAMRGAHANTNMVCSSITTRIRARSARDAKRV